MMFQMIEMLLKKNRRYPAAKAARLFDRCSTVRSMRDVRGHERKRPASNDDDQNVYGRNRCQRPCDNCGNDRHQTCNAFNDDPAAVESRVSNGPQPDTCLVERALG